MIQAQAGICGLFARIDDGPRLLPMNLSDRVTGLQLANVVLAALFERERSGEGQAIEVPMFESLVHLVMADHLAGFNFVPPEESLGYARLLSKQRRPFRTADGHLCAPIYTDDHWRRFLAFVGEEALLGTDLRFVSIDARIRNADVVLGWLAQRLTERTNAEWLEVFHQLDIPAAPVNSLEALMDDPHLKAVRFFEQQEHPTEGALLAPRNPSRWSRTPPANYAAAPLLGEANAAVSTLLAHPKPTA
jgi:crotonobetainyl-CoA:carnitine CoA-transferase CaiB-like acyl-CoA transferase